MSQYENTNNGASVHYSRSRNELVDERFDASDGIGAQIWLECHLLAINPGLEHWFATDFDAVAGFVRTRRYWVVAGAPVCREEDLARAVAELERLADNENRRTCYLGAEDRLYRLLCERPDHSLALLGAQPVWRSREFIETYVPTGLYDAIRVELTFLRQRKSRRIGGPAHAA